MTVPPKIPAARSTPPGSGQSSQAGLTPPPTAGLGSDAAADFTPDAAAAQGAKVPVRRAQGPAPSPVAPVAGEGASASPSEPSGAGSAGRRYAPGEESRRPAPGASPGVSGPAEGARLTAASSAGTTPAEAGGLTADHAPASAGTPLSGQAWRDAVRGAQSRLAAEQRRARGRYTRARGGFRPGMARRPPDGGSVA